MWIDTHAHLSSFEDEKCVAAIENAKKHDVWPIINICTDKETLEKGWQLSQNDAGIYHAAAITPHDVKKPQDFALFEKAAKDNKLVAIGETGLDYYYENSDRTLQKEWMIKHFLLALEVDLPLLIHCRDAFFDFFDLLDKHYLSSSQSKRGILHCFTGSLEDAKKAIDRGFYISFSGIVTFKNAKALQEIAKQIPLEHCVVETDAPFLAPQSKRGQVNEPAFVTEVGEAIAILKGVGVKEVERITTQNAEAIFSLELL
ncbi:MAG: putative metal-dependent hydrolase YcfH [Chlamydiae bacterium]|nr:putative metal-dependent hydrolase YcfH [Chlamydiota bacterium]